MLFFMMAVGEPLREKKVRKKIDESLITRIGRDDRDALEELYRLTERPLINCLTPASGISPISR